MSASKDTGQHPKESMIDQTSSEEFEAYSRMQDKIDEAMIRLLESQFPNTSKPPTDKQIPSSEELKTLAGSDLNLAMMLKLSLPLTRANYLELMLSDKGKTEADLDAEQLMSIPDWLE